MQVKTTVRISIILEVNLVEFFVSAVPDALLSEFSFKLEFETYGFGEGLDTRHFYLWL